MRQIILDTETTGLRVEEGHRMIEVACIVMMNRKLTGEQFHRYLNPERSVEAGAFAVHGISTEFLKDKPLFAAIANELMAFISGAELIIHNAPFDLSFLNNEFLLTRQGWKAVTEYCQVVDTLQIARQRHVSQRNSLDALCKRYAIDNSKRDLHGALLDAHLLAQVYLAMTGGQGSFFDTMNEHQSTVTKNTEIATVVSLPAHRLTVLNASEAEEIEHRRYLESLNKQGNCLWLEE